MKLPENVRKRDYASPETDLVPLRRVPAVLGGSGNTEPIEGGDAPDNPWN